MWAGSNRAQYIAEEYVDMPEYPPHTYYCLRCGFHGTRLEVYSHVVEVFDKIVYSGLARYTNELGDSIIAVQNDL